MQTKGDVIKELLNAVNVLDDDKDLAARIITDVIMTLNNAKISIPKVEKLQDSTLPLYEDA